MNDSADWKFPQGYAMLSPLLEWNMNTELNQIVVTMEDGTEITCPSQIPAGAVAPSATDKRGLHYLGALANNDVVSLSYPLEVDTQIRFLTLDDSHGWRIYRRSVSFILAKIVKNLYPSSVFSVEHSLGTGFYCSFELNGEKRITEEQIAHIEKHMRELVDHDVPIRRRKITFEQAVKQFQQEKQWDKYNLLRYRNPPKIVIYDCDGFSDLAHGPLANNTGALGHFKLFPYPPGFVIQFPDRDKAPEIPPFESQPHLFHIFKEHKEWGRILGVRTVGQLNEIIANRGIGDLIRIAEAFHEKKIASIADRIAESKSTNWILIAGPSSAGKTTLAKRLGVQLRVNGLRPVTISTDDYFVDREKTPRDEDGEYDFEDIETIDLELLNQHLEALDRGEEVDLPRFNFQAGKREYKGDRLKIEEDQLVIMEGIHCLNPRLSANIRPERKYKIYISALTQLNLDFNNRISTTDNRLLRRLIRDHQFRGNTALTTLNMWPSVRRGEKKWIFPHQQEADIAFNSALDYELGVLKPLAEPLLAEVKPFHPQYAEAKRLLDFLDSFLSVSSELVPPTSILREYIGESSFRY
ncbi:MAG: nucleoside kinase [Verrucomicrobia bacterium]|nr:nucleoside kinase [Verrucomicrobiota bacterium]